MLPWNPDASGEVKALAVSGNNSSRVAESPPAALEIGPNPRVRSFEKIEDLFDALGGTSGFGSSFTATKSATGLGGEPMLVSMGSIVSQLFNTSTNNPGVVLDLTDFPEITERKLEGLTVLNPNEIANSNDNDFGIGADPNSVSTVWTIRLGTLLR